MDILNSLVGVVGLKGLILALLGIWLVIALIKKLFKVAVIAGVIFLAVSYAYPFVSGYLK